MKVLVGLGNPGTEYSQTRHNFGFMVMDALAQQLGGTWKKAKFNAEVLQGIIGDEKVLLVKPLTYMNLSGEAVGAALNFFKEPKSSLLVVYDEIDLPLGRMRFARAGSAAGHNGIKSLIQHLSGNDFCRLRMGVGRPLGQMSVSDYVLGRFHKSEVEEVDQMIYEATNGIEIFVRHGITKAMNDFNQKNE